MWTIHSALIAESTRVKTSFDVNERQLKVEKRKGNKTSARVTDLKGDIDKLKDEHAELEEWLTELYEGAFVHRYRDVDPLVRCEAIDALAVWTLEYQVRLLCWFVKLILIMVCRKPTQPMFTCATLDGPYLTEVSWFAPVLCAP